MQAPYLAATERDVLARFIARLEIECADAVRRVVLFGSKARGDADEESDTDVLVVVADDTAFRKVEAITREEDFKAANGSRLNWRILTQEDYADYRRLMFPFYVDVRRDGIELWDEAARLIEEADYPLDYQEGAPRTMTLETKETIRIYIEEARRSWQVVERLRDEMPLFAIPSAYYAAFYVATAALYSLSVIRTKHEGVRNGVNEFLVKPRLLEKEYAEIYENLLNSREWVDYRPFKRSGKTISDDEARQLLQDAERFIERMKQFLRERGAID